MSKRNQGGGHSPLPTRSQTTVEDPTTMSGKKSKRQGSPAGAAAEAEADAETPRSLFDEATAFDSASKAASALYASGSFGEAADAFAALIDAATALSPLPTAGGSGGGKKAANGKASGKAGGKAGGKAHGSLATIRQREACAALPALLSNRAACALQMAAHFDSHLTDCLGDCDDALRATAAATAQAAALADTPHAPPPPPPPFKIKLRRLEAHRRLGQGDKDYEKELTALRNMATSDAEKAAVEHVAAALAGVGGK